MVNLIFDRKNEDVARLKSLREKVRNRTATTSEYEEWLTSLKGAYNNTDLNRVGEAINYLANLLNDYGYANTATARTDWEIGEKPNPEQMADYLSNLNKLKACFVVRPTTPTLPNDVHNLVVHEANNIEKFLYDINELIENMESNFIFTNVAICGQERIWQQRFRKMKNWSSLGKFTFNNYLDTDLLNMIAIPSVKEIDKTKYLGLTVIDARQGIGESIRSINKSMEILDNLIGVI